MTESSQYEGMIQRLRAATRAERAGHVRKTEFCALDDHFNCPGTWTVFPDEEGRCECECHATIRVETLD